MHYITAKPLWPQVSYRVRLLTQDEVRHERARQLAIETGKPTRVRGTRVEVLLGDVWAEQLDPITGS